MTTTQLPIADVAQVRAHAGVVLGRHRSALAGVLGLFVVATLAGLAGPWLLGRLVDDVRAGTTVAAVDRLVLVLAVFVLAEAVLTRFARKSAMVLGEEVFAELREDFMRRVTSLPLSTVERAGTGDLVSRTTNDVEALSWTVRFAVPSLIVAAVTTLLTSVAAVVAGGVLAVSLLVGVPMLWLSTRWYLRLAPRGYHRERAVYARLGGVVTETVDSARVVDALHLGARRRRMVDDALRSCVVAERYTLGMRAAWYPWLEIGYRLPLVATVALGGLLVAHTGPFGVEVTIGQVTTVALYAVRIVDPLSELLEWLDEIQVGAAALARIIGIDAVPPDRTASDRVPSGTDLVARDVRFAYREGHDVVRGVDLVLRPGERLAVVGPSGAGKSTLGRILAGIHPPTGGEVTVGGVPVTGLPLETLHREVALITQEHHVFVGTLADNLLLAAPESDESEMRRALDAVDATPWVDALDDGLATVVGSGGLALSPAQAQQLALARLVLADPHTLVLDEATSLLDPRAARHLERSLSSVLEGRTVVAIAHRLHTAHDADRVAVVEDGVISEIGPHDELVASDGSYARLWRSWRDE